MSETRKLNYPYTSCTAGEYVYMQNYNPHLVEALGDYLFIEREHNDDPRLERSIPLLFVFHGSSRQRGFWLRNKNINPKHVHLIIEPERLQGLRARAVPVSLDPFWHPMGIGERSAALSSEHYIRDLRDRYGDLWDVRKEVNPIPDNEKWVRLA
jgi:hypothetical protein